ncbi:MAG: hypothetical protein HUK19_02035 [Fibrobacter sp.]|nr:hypothetical protein [Fibrobacter sp.]
MYFRNSHIVPVLFFALLLMATGVFAQDEVNCVPYEEGKTDGRCFYYRISNADGSKSSAGPKLCALDDPKITSCSYKDADGKYHRVLGAEFELYAPEAGTAGLTIQTKSDATPLKNGDELKALGKEGGADSGYVLLQAYSYYPINNVHIGVKTASMAYPSVTNVLNFYAPEIRYFIEDSLVTDESRFNPEVGDTIVVTAKLFVPDGMGKANGGKVNGGEVDTLINDAPLYFRTTGDSENLKFLGTNNKPLAEKNGLPYINVNKGVAVFKIVADMAVTDGSHFSLAGFPNKVNPTDEEYGEYFVNDAFPGELTFTDRDLPSVKVAAIYDHDGDGVGDSIRVWLSGNTSSVTLDSFAFNWPTGETYHDYDGGVSVNTKKDLYVLPEVQTKLQDPEKAEGSLTAKACSSIGDKRCAVIKSNLKDSIGAVIQAVTLVISDNGSDKDTLVVRFNKMVDTTWTSGPGLLLMKNPLDVEVVNVKKNEWTFVIKPGKISVGDSVKINTASKSGDGVITAADGVPTAANNQYVAVSDYGKIIANENNGVYDRDGDGRMDSVSLGFDTPITREKLKDMKITFYWLDTEGELLAITPKADDLDLSADGHVIGYSLDPEKLGVREMLTDINPKYMKSEKYGYAKVENKVVLDGKTETVTVELDLNDYMPPVISKNFLKPESFQYMEADKFTITFSEPVGTDKFKLDKSSLAFFVDGEWKNYPLEHPEWSDGNRTLTVRLETGEKLTKRMNPADSVRFDNFDSGICDKMGNNVSSEIPAVMVQGDPRVITETASYADLNLAEELSTRVKPFTSDVIKGEFDSEAMSSLGVLLDVGFATVMKKNSAGDMVPDLKKIGLEYELDVYTNLGGYVGGAKEKILCDDEFFFDGNCLENPEKIYVRWNMRADNGRKVGVGVYLAKFKVKVFGAQSDFKIERIYRWGITSTRH